MDVLKRVPIKEQEPKVRAANFEEVCLGYTKEEAMEEASRCINCKNAQCIKGCPVGIDIPAFIQQVKEGNIEKSYQVIAESSALPAVCGRVCPQESQCGSVSAASKANRYRLVSWSALRQTGQEKMASSPRLPVKRTAVKSQ